jgi:multiple sugar transport system permease protein
MPEGKRPLLRDEAESSMNTRQTQAAHAWQGLLIALLGCALFGASLLWLRPFVAGLAIWLLLLPSLVLSAALVLFGLSRAFDHPRFGRPLSRLLSYALMLSLAAFLIAPFVWMVLISLHPSNAPIPPVNEILTFRAPGEEGQTVPPQWQNYSTVLFMENIPVFRFFLNSLFVTVTIVIAQLIICSLAAYGFSRLQFRGRDTFFVLFLLSLMFAGPITQIPVYLLVRNLGWLDTYWALIVPGISSAFNVFLLRQFFLQIPKELDEAARIDGAGDFRIYWKVILPLSPAALATAGAFTFFAVWTDFFWPLLATNSMEMRTLEVGLSVFKNSYGQTNWPLQMTAAVIVLLPLLVAFLFAQRYFTRGIALGGIK